MLTLDFFLFLIIKYTLGSNRSVNEFRGLAQRALPSLLAFSMQEYSAGMFEILVWARGRSTSSKEEARNSRYIGAFSHCIILSVQC